MNTMRNLLIVGLMLAAVMAAGCEKKYTITVTNVTSDMQNVQLLEKGVFPEASFTVAPDGGKESVVIKQDEDETTAYTLKANAHSTQFTLSKRSFNPMFFHITPNGIIGPVSKHTKVTETWDIKRTEEGPRREVIE